LIPDFYRSSLASYGITTAGGIPLPEWNPLLATIFMDYFGIQTQVVSVSEPGVYYLPTSALRMQMAQQLNNYMHDTLINSKVYINRFGSFGVLPLGDLNDPVDIANAQAEAVRIVQQLQLDGIGLYSNYAGIYLGDPRLEPLMATMNSLGVLVFVHPVTPLQMPNLTLPSFLYEFPFDTTRAAVNLLYKGVFLRYPNIRWLLAHAGGTVPFLSYRTGLLTLDLNPTVSRYSELYYDTALSAAPPAMTAVRQITNVTHVMFATDWPFSSLVYLPKLPGDPNPELNLTFNSTERPLVDGKNALQQMPTLARRLGISV